MELPRELKRLIEKYKAKYHIIGKDEDILKKVIPELEDEDIIKVYDELCEEENFLILTKKGYRPNFEKYREEILSYLDDSVVKSEIVKREQRQSSKPLLEQRNYTYISEFAITLDSKVDKLRIIKDFHKKVEHLEKEREGLNNEDKVSNIQLTIHILTCIKHIIEKMKIELVLYRGPKFKNRKFKVEREVFDKIKKLRDKKYIKDFNDIKARERVLTQIVNRIKQLEFEERQAEEDVER